MLDIKLTPQEGGDAIDVTVNTSDVYFWEKTHRGKTMQGLLDNKSAVDLVEVAHVAAQRLGVFTSTNTDEFARTYVLDFSSDDAEDSEPDPTQ